MWPRYTYRLGKKIYIPGTVVQNEMSFRRFLVLTDRLRSLIIHSENMLATKCWLHRTTRVDNFVVETRAALPAILLTCRTSKRRPSSLPNTSGQKTSFRESFCTHGVVVPRSMQDDGRRGVVGVHEKLFEPPEAPETQKCDSRSGVRSIGWRC